MNTKTTSLSDLIGPWMDSEWNTGLIERCKIAWSKPLQDLSRRELATLLRQRLATEHLLPMARRRLEEGVDDETEIFEGELQEAMEWASRAF